MNKTYDFYYKADNIDEVLKELVELNVDITVKDALKAGLKVFNNILKYRRLNQEEKGRNRAARRHKVFYALCCK